MFRYLNSVTNRFPPPGMNAYFIPIWEALVESQSWDQSLNPLSASLQKKATHFQHHTAWHLHRIPDWFIVSEFTKCQAISGGNKLLVRECMSTSTGENVLCSAFCVEAGWFEQNEPWNNAVLALRSSVVFCRFSEIRRFCFSKNYVRVKRQRGKAVFLI